PADPPSERAALISMASPRARVCPSLHGVPRSVTWGASYSSALRLFYRGEVATSRVTGNGGLNCSAALFGAACQTHAESRLAPLINDGK
ncbi:hypothetical protein KUCAC02_030828, partial [Chaenocephalus aceratus]